MSNTPLITVLMSVYNAGGDLERAVQSILDQSFADFELLIIDDGSNDGSSEVLEIFAQADPRITLITQDNIGLTKSLNKGLKLAKGKYIARQDADDFALPNRLENQMAYLKNYPDIHLIGSNSIDLYADGLEGIWGYHTAENLQKIVYRQTPFPHSTAMFSKEKAVELGGYDETFRTSQDMDLWIRFAKSGPIAMIEEPLIQRSVGDNSISAKKKFRQFKDALSIRLKHSPNQKFKMIYISLRALLIAYAPQWVIRWRQRKKKQHRAQTRSS